MTEMNTQSYRQKNIHKEAFYGRAKGRPVALHEEQALKDSPLLLTLDDCRDDLHALFSVPVERIHFEIGFGAGEHLIHRAQQNPEIGFIGAEPFHNGIAKCNYNAREAGLQNLRIFPFDVRPLLDALPPQSFDALYLLYPDPWRKRRHYKRRMVSDRNLKRFSRVLKPDAAFYFASDWANYTAWTLSHIQRSNDFAWNAAQAADWTLPYEGWITTRYEQKAFREGRLPSYLRFEKRLQALSPLSSG